MTTLLYFLLKKYTRVRIFLFTRFTFSGRIVLLAAGVAIFFGLNTERSMFYQLFPLLLIFLGLGFLCSLRLPHQLSCERKLPETCVAGQVLKYPIFITNNHPKRADGLFFREWVAVTLPTKDDFFKLSQIPKISRSWALNKLKIAHWHKLVTFREENELPEATLPVIPSGGSHEIEVQLLPQVRGNIHLDGYMLYRKDPLGLFARPFNVVSPQNILVLPKLYPAPQLNFDGSRKYHQGGITAASEHGESEEFISLREYAPGDPIKKIDWKSSAKMDELIVKQYKNEYFSRFALILDTFSTHSRFPLFEEAVSVAASLVMSQDLTEDLLDLMFVGDKCYTETAGKGLQGIEQMLKILAAVQPCEERRLPELTRLVKTHVSLLSGVVVVLQDIDEERKKLLDFISSTRIPCKIVLVTERKINAEKQLHSLEIHQPILVVEQGMVDDNLLIL